MFEDSLEEKLKGKTEEEANTFRNQFLSDCIQKVLNQRDTLPSSLPQSMNLFGEQNNDGAEEEQRRKYPSSMDEDNHKDSQGESAEQPLAAGLGEEEGNEVRIKKENYPYLNQGNTAQSTPMKEKEKDAEVNEPSNLSQAMSSQNTDAKTKTEISRINCVLCRKEEKCILFLPCKHAKCCEKCAPLFQNCPTCRTKIETTMKISL